METLIFFMELCLLSVAAIARNAVITLNSFPFFRQSPNH